MLVKYCINSSKAVAGVDHPTKALSTFCMHIEKPLRIKKGKSHKELKKEITLLELAHSHNFLTLCIFHVEINMLARFDEFPSMTLQNIKETKRYRWMYMKTVQYTIHSV